MTKTFVKSANLRSLLLKGLCPEAIVNCRHHFTKFLSPDIRNGTLIDINLFMSNPENDPPDTESYTATKITLSETTFKALRLRFLDTLPTIRRIKTFHTFEGRTFTTRSRHEGNSSVLVKSNLDGSLKPAQIQEILEVSSKEILYVIRHPHSRTIDACQACVCLRRLHACLSEEAMSEPALKVPVAGVLPSDDLQLASIFLPDRRRHVLPSRWFGVSL